MLDRETSEKSQADLLRRIAAQDREALGQFYDETAGLLYSIAVRILGDAAEAEEAVQDAFVQIWTKAASFDRALGTPQHWALAITRNRCIDRLRARKRRFELIHEYAEEFTSNSGSRTSESASVLSVDELAAVRAALGGLPREQHQVIQMAFFGGLTHQEIAEALAQPLGTIKARIRRGMLKLRESLQSYL